MKFTTDTEPLMKRFHIALAVANLDESIADYSHRLGQPPSAVVPGQYAMWRTDLLNFSINEKPERAGQLRHVGFEDDAVRGYSISIDVNGLEWESFSAAEQDARIVSAYGVPVCGGAGRAVGRAPAGHVTRFTLRFAVCPAKGRCAVRFAPAGRLSRRAATDVETA